MTSTVIPTVAMTTRMMASSATATANNGDDYDIDNHDSDCSDDADDHEGGGDDGSDDNDDDGVGGDDGDTTFSRETES